MKNRKVLSLSIFTLSLGLAACSPVGKSATSLAQQSVENLGCKTAQSETWSTLHRIAEEAGSYPSAEEVRTAFLEAGKLKGLDGSAYENYVEAFVVNYSNIIDGIRASFAPVDLAGWKKALAEMEIGARVTEVHSKLQDKIVASQEKLDEAEHMLGKSCAVPDEGQVHIPAPPGDPKTTDTVWDQLKATGSPEVYGARRTLATAYQSCDVLKLAPVSTSTPNVQGISIVGNHPAGGKKREISSVSQVANTHYYIKNIKQPAPTCFKVSGSPLIYDFGGKPYVSSNEKVLDMFKNGGSGTNVLGIDCSAYVFSALALSGLKLDYSTSKPLKASLVNGVSSTMLKDPQNNGMRCLDKISVSKTVSVLPGDIIAISGHVIMIDAVGADPLGLNRANQVADCTTAKMSYTGFDFTIAQSAPVKEGMGINRYVAKDYFATSSTFRDGVTRYAVAACKAKFGVSSTVDTSSLSITRHRKTPECKATALQENKEECIASCSAI